MEHHVYFWLKPERKNSADYAEFEKGLGSLLKINTIAAGLWGRPASTPIRPVTENSWDYAISLKFISLAEHDRYQIDPLHDAFVAEFKNWWEKVQVMDLESSE